MNQADDGLLTLLTQAEAEAAAAPSAAERAAWTEIAAAFCAALADPVTDGAV